MRNPKLSIQTNSIKRREQYQRRSLLIIAVPSSGEIYDGKVSQITMISSYLAMNESDLYDPQRIF